jgi:hypothetical protein
MRDFKLDFRLLDDQYLMLVRADDARIMRAEGCLLEFIFYAFLIVSLEDLIIFVIF